MSEPAASVVVHSVASESSARKTHAPATVKGVVTVLGTAVPFVCHITYVGDGPGPTLSEILIPFPFFAWSDVANACGGSVDPDTPRKAAEAYPDILREVAAAAVAAQPFPKKSDDVKISCGKDRP